ncbi:MAG: SIS domain-containing protein [Spirulina sp. SIO3F2]|nr:SIS domain-containing protein [Spirulina sp. SIO3F2]
MPKSCFVNLIIPVSKVDLVVYDFDGVMTNNLVAIAQNNVESVQCNRGDGLGIRMVKGFDIPQLILSTETNPVVTARANKLKLPVIQGAENKLRSLTEYCQANHYNLSKTVYIGNDLNDLEVMQAVGWPICPADAHPKIRQLSCIITQARGGEGVVREFGEKLLVDDVVETKHIVNSHSKPSVLTEVKAQLQDSIDLRVSLLGSPNLLSKIIELSDLLITCIQAGGCIFWAGNGGSFADAQHLAAELVGRFMREREPWASICLGTNSSTFSSISNDYDFSQVFSRELQALCKPNDALILLSTSGNSRNLLNVAKVALENDLKIFALLGKSGGQLAYYVPSQSIVVPSYHTARIQEIHIMLGHIVCDLVEQSLAR